MSQYAHSLLQQNLRVERHTCQPVLINFANTVLWISTNYRVLCLLRKDVYILMAIIFYFCWNQFLDFSVYFMRIINFTIYLVHDSLHNLFLYYYWIWIQLSFSFFADSISIVKLDLNVFLLFGYNAFTKWEKYRITVQKIE